MRTTRSMLVCGALLASAVSALAQTGDLDQVSPIVVAQYNAAPNLVWQAQVRAGLDGILSGVTLTLSGVAGSTVLVRVRAGDGWNTSPALFSGTVSKPTGVPYERVHVDTSGAGIRTTAGATFVIELQGGTGGAWLNGSYVDPASGPPRYFEPLFLDGPGCFDDCGTRIGFETWVTGATPGFCTGDGQGSVPCPCANEGLAGRGCDNSFATGGARLVFSGTTNPDTIVLTTTGAVETALSVFVQGDLRLAAPLAYGDGLRCVGGALKRIGVETATAGFVTFPGPGDPAIRTQSAALGDPIPPGATRWYQTYYRDVAGAFCPAPAGAGWNASNGIAVVW